MHMRKNRFIASARVVGGDEGIGEPGPLHSRGAELNVVLHDFQLRQHPLAQPTVSRVGTLVAVPIQVHFQPRQFPRERLPYQSLIAQLPGQAGGHSEQQVGLLHGAQRGLVMLAAQTNVPAIALPC